jgi:hypothetical protein
MNLNSLTGKTYFAGNPNGIRKHLAIMQSPLLAYFPYSEQKFLAGTNCLPSFHYILSIWHGNKLTWDWQGADFKLDILINWKNVVMASSNAEIIIMYFNILERTCYYIAAHPAHSIRPRSVLAKLLFNSSIYKLVQASYLTRAGYHTTCWLVWFRRGALTCQ